ncbi:30S ribosomal protein S6, partial [bacterium]|nr:30S ribosomal protein S6 [bacterium]
SGYYVFYYFNAEPDVPHKVRDSLMLKEDVVRHMIVISEHMPESIGKGGEDGLLIGEA